MKRSKNKIKHFLLCTICLILCVALLCSCSFSSPERTAKKFVSAIKNCDWDTMLSCMSPVAQSEYKAATQIGNGLLSAFGVNLDLSVLIPAAFGLSRMENAYDNIKITEIKMIGSDYAYAYADFYGNGTLLESVEIPMIKIDSEWYIDFNWEGLI